MLSTAYRLLTDLGAPALKLYLNRRLAKGREDPVRFSERLGVASVERPEGLLIWCHAASVGESMSLLTLIDKMRDPAMQATILVTTGTVTSAHMLAGRLPAGVIHQYMPVDRVGYVQKFLAHWRPNFVIWVESELWPNMLSEIKKRSIPAALINARMSENSFQNWQRAKGWAEEILSTFSLCLTQTEEEKIRFEALGARDVAFAGNLKYAAKALPVDEAALADLQQAVAARAIWVMASTHRGEEELALVAHKQLKVKFPHLLTIIVPRHAVRGNEVAMRIVEQGLTVARRSKGEAITNETEIYLADTMGELGLFYRLAPICVIGGSFAPVGGHNPIEAAQLGCAIIFGPRMFNFAAIAREFATREAALPLSNDNELAFSLARLLGSPEERQRYAQAAKLLADQKQSVLYHVLDRLRPMLREIGVTLP